MLLLPYGMSLFAGEVESGLTLALGFGFLHAMVKAFNEELIFRDALPSIIGGKAKLLYVDIVSSVAFGAFHFAVSGASLLVMAFLSVLGFIWSQVYRRFGLMGSTGSHFAYNLAALGVLSKVFGGV